MQWLIDIIKEWIDVRGNLPASFVDRGDPPDYDFDEVALAPAIGWQDLDLSGIVPEFTSAVLLHVKIQNTAIPARFQLRRAGNAETYNVSQVTSIVANIQNALDCTIPLPTNRHIEYRGILGVWTVATIVVKGWWF